MPHVQVIPTVQTVVDQATAYFHSLPVTIPYWRRVQMETAFVVELTQPTRLADRRAQRGVPSAPTAAQQQLAAAWHAAREVATGVHYQTGPRRGQQRAALRQARG